QVQHAGAAEFEAGHVDRAVLAGMPGDLEGGVVAPRGGRLGVFERLFAGGFRKRTVRPWRQSYGLDLPGETVHGKLLGRLPRRLHARVHAIAEDRPVGFRAVVVLARGDVAGTAGEVDLKDVRILVL